MDDLTPKGGDSAASQVGTGQGVAAGSGVHITFGSTGARFTQPALLLRDELRRKVEAKRADGGKVVPVDLDFAPGRTVWPVPKGWRIVDVWVNGAPKRLG